MPNLRARESFDLEFQGKFEWSYILCFHSYFSVILPIEDLHHRHG